VPYTIDFSGVEFPKGLDKVGLHFNDVHSMKPVQRLGLQIYVLRKTLQYAFGMEVAAVLCHEPLPTPKVPLTDTLARDLTSRWVYEWEKVRSFDALKPHWHESTKTDGNRLSFGAGPWSNYDEKPYPNQDAKILEVTLQVILSRLTSFMNGNAASMRTMTDSAFELVKNPVDSKDFFEDLGMAPSLQTQLESGPSDLWCTHGIGQHLSPMLAFAGSLESLKMQEAAFEKRKAQLAGSDEDKWFEYVKERWEEGMQTPEITGLLDEFLTLKTEEGQTRFRGRDGPSPLDEPAGVGDENVARTQLTGATFPWANDPDGKEYHPLRHNNANFRLLPVAYMNRDALDKFKHESGASPHGDVVYNHAKSRPQMFAMLDAAALLWHARAYHTPADGPRPEYSEFGNQDEMHYCAAPSSSPSCARARSTSRTGRRTCGSSTSRRCPAAPSRRS